MAADPQIEHYPCPENLSMRYLCLFLLSAIVWSLTAQPAGAVLQFYKVWKEQYLDDHPDQEYAALVNKGTNKCFVCHVGKQRKHHNVYGQHFVDLLDRKTDTKDKEKIAAAIKQVGELHFEADDEASETFNQRIAESKFPGGELEELKKEPAE
jgi:cytochrome c2